MRHKKIKWSWVLLLGLSPTMLTAQSLVTTSGGNATGTGKTSYTIGQIAYSTVSNTAGKWSKEYKTLTVLPIIQQKEM